MQTYRDIDGNMSFRSLECSAWERIYSGSHKKVVKGKDCGPWVSKLNERKLRSVRMMERKRQSQEKISKLMLAKKKYEYLSLHEKARISYPKGIPTVVVRNECGKFTGVRIIF